MKHPSFCAPVTVKEEKKNILSWFCVIISPSPVTICLNFKVSLYCGQRLPEMSSNSKWSSLAEVEQLIGGSLCTGSHQICSKTSLVSGNPLNFAPALISPSTQKTSKSYQHILMNWAYSCSPEDQVLPFCILHFPLVPHSHWLNVRKISRNRQIAMICALYSCSQKDELCGLMISTFVLVPSSGHESLYCCDSVFRWEHSRDWA